MGPSDGEDADALLEALSLDGSQILERVPQLNGHVPDRLGNKDLAGPAKARSRAARFTALPNRSPASRLTPSRGQAAGGVKPQPRRVNHQPIQASPEGQTSSISRTSTQGGWARGARTHNPRIKRTQDRGNCGLSLRLCPHCRPTSPTNRPQLTSFHATNHATPLRTGAVRHC
jgi:hypothetical protein